MAKYDQLPDDFDAHIGDFVTTEVMTFIDGKSIQVSAEHNRNG